MSCVDVSHEPPERPASVREGGARHALQAQQCAATAGGARGPGADQGLQQLPAAPLQEARLQELLQHLPPVLHLAPVQHPVSTCAVFRYPYFHE